MRKTESQKIALCGMLGALSVVLLLIGSALQIGTYAAPMLAAFLIIPVLEEYGPRYALTLYATVSILAVLFVPETELAFFYVLVMGYYPVLRVKLNTLKNTVLRWVIKFAVFNAATVLVYLLLFALLGPAVLDELLADPERVMSEGLEAFAPKYRADGALLIQAHPFRNKCTPAPAELLDGVEVLNLNPRHDSHNDLALAYAEEHHLLMTAGSDCHRPGDEGTTGILAETLPEDSFGYADLIRSGKYTLIRPE